jgi:hypothetical protein
VRPLVHRRAPSAEEFRIGLTFRHATHEQKPRDEGSGSDAIPWDHDVGDIPETGDALIDRCSCDETLRTESLLADLHKLVDRAETALEACGEPAEVPCGGPPELSVRGSRSDSTR